MNRFVEEKQLGSEVKKEEVKLEDILNSIRGMIDDHKLGTKGGNTKLNESIDENLDNSEDNNDDNEASYVRDDDANYNKYDDDVLELNHVLDTDASDEMISGEVKIQSAELFDKFACEAKDAVAQNVKKSHANRNEVKDGELDNLVNKLVRPMLKEWLNNNLPSMVEKIIRDELKQLIPKK